MAVSRYQTNFFRVFGNSLGCDKNHESLYDKKNLLIRFHTNFGDFYPILKLIQKKKNQKKNYTEYSDPHHI